MNGKRNCTGGCAGQEAADLNPPINLLIFMEIIKYQLDLISKYAVKTQTDKRKIHIFIYWHQLF